MNYVHGSRRLRVLIPVLVLAASCQSAVETTPSPEPAARPTPPNTAPLGSGLARQTSAVQQSELSAGESRSLRTAIYSEPDIDPLCQYGDPNQTLPSLYEVAMPGINVVPDVAKPPQPPQPRLEGDSWVVEIPLREDAVWSDGQPITADDFAFAFEVGECGWQWQPLLDVEAVDEHTVKITFADEPGFGTWPHGVGVDSQVFAEHYWSPHFEDAQADGRAAVEAIDDPAEAVWEGQRQAAEAAGDDFTKTVGEITPAEIDAYLKGIHETAVKESLYSVPAIGAPSGGPMVLTEWTPGVSIRYVANSRYYRSGETIQSGGVTYEIGPFIDEYVQFVFGSRNEAGLALLNGEVDFVGLTSQAALENLLEADPEVAVVRNDVNGFFYLGFNLRKTPMSDLAFRRALAMMIDRDFLTEDLFQGEFQPAWTLLPEANLQWFDRDTAARIASKYRDLDRYERLEVAVRILEEAGYTWDSKPGVRSDETDKPIIASGSGIRMPDGTVAPELEILTLGAGQGSFAFPTYALFVEHWLDLLGFEARAQPSAGPLIVNKVWPGIGQEPTFDIYLLGWTLGNPAFPTFHESFLHSRNLAEVNDGNNAVGYVNPEFDQLTERLIRVKNAEEARDIAWQLEEILHRDLPYIVLNKYPLVDAHRTRVVYPFTDTLGGISNFSFAGLVRIRE